jgi:glutamyl-tRNA synthetase
MHKLISKNEKIVVRMAPSPSGMLHVGTARTALFNYLFAKRYGGKFILRVEDTDAERSAKRYTKNILEGLTWLGIKWDGKPLYQSERKALYKKYLKQLLDSKNVFYCWHTKDELQREKQRQIEQRRAPRHICEYRNIKMWNADTIKRSIIRFKNNHKGDIEFYDYVRGGVVFDSALIGDFSIAKNLNAPLYNFAVVVDDFEMKVSHILRGEDHISNTPRQILLQNALGFPRPKFIHVPLLLGPDKSKLSKRHGETSVDEYKKMGYLPEAMFNFLALLGWHPKHDKEIMSKNKIVKEFDVKDIQKSGAIFDIEKLNWMNAAYIRKLPIKKFTEMSAPFLKAKADFKMLKNVAALEQERIKKLSDIAEAADYFFKEPKYDISLLVWKTMKVSELKEMLLNLYDIVNGIDTKDWNRKGIEKVIMPQALETGDRGRMLWPLRAALSGKKASPGPFEIMEVLGREKTLKRIKTAIKKL